MDIKIIASKITTAFKKKATRTNLLSNLAWAVAAVLLVWGVALLSVPAAIMVAAVQMFLVSYAIGKK